jgi:hypothetical protein
MPHLARLASLLTTNLYWVMQSERGSFIYYIEQMAATRTGLVYILY